MKPQPLTGTLLVGGRRFYGESPAETVFSDSGKHQSWIVSFSGNTDCCLICEKDVIVSLIGSISSHSMTQLLTSENCGRCCHGFKAERYSKYWGVLKINLENLRQRAGWSGLTGRLLHEA
jgi:hypothetical protein